MAEKIKQTAGHDQLGEIAPLFATLNDDILFGKVWNQDEIELKTKCIITIVSLVSSGITDTSLEYHLQNAKNHGVSRDEMVAVITHIAMYVGWPKAWAVFRMIKNVWSDNSLGDSGKDQFQQTIAFEIGKPNDAFKEFFIGQSYLHQVASGSLPVFNVTFEPGCRNNWHVHKAKSGGGQLLICVGGKGIYQEWGKDPILMVPGDSVTIPANVKHWHGAIEDSWFSHLAIEIPGTDSSNEWLEKVADAEYNKANEFVKDLI